MRRAAALLLLASLVPLSAHARPRSLQDPDALEAFFDGAVRAFLEAEDADGMTVSVVEDGRLLFAKGYGVATRETGEPVDPERTLFRIGSVSKIFLATALMQLVEQGRIDLDTDLNQYLDGVEIPETFPEPVTLRHVMTHTAGFEDSYRDVFVAPEAQLSLRETLAGYLPERVRPPGELIAYSNHATALAGLVVEQVSGEPYEAYLERHILEPLGMAHTSARQPLPAELAADASTGPRPDDYFTHVGIVPAGSVSSTATDMARFMIAHLQLGRYEQARILGEDTARTMQTRLFTLDPRVNGLAHQFFERDVGGLRVIGHGGGMVTHITSMALLPEHGVGFFASINAQSRAPRELLRLFLERYFPQARPERPESMDGAAERLTRYEGWYRESRTGFHHLSKLSRFMTTKKAVGADDRLQFLEEEWVETEPGLFRRIDGPEWLVFQEDESGRVTRALRGYNGHSVLVRVPWWEGLDFHGAAILVIVFLLLWPVFHRPVWRTARWWRTARGGGVPGLARWLSGALRVAALVFVVSFAAGSIAMSRSFGVEITAAMRLALTLPFVIAPLALGTAVCCVLLWRRGEGSRRSRVGYTTLVLGALALLWWADTWNVLLTRV